jgi:hypothetical protein
MSSENKINMRFYNIYQVSCCQKEVTRTGGKLPCIKFTHTNSRVKRIMRFAPRLARPGD